MERCILKIMLLCMVLGACASGKDTETVLSLKTDHSLATKVCIEPLAYWKVFQYADAPLNSEKMAELHYPFTSSCIVQVQTTERIGKVFQSSPVYLTPSARLQIEFVGKDVHFTGDLAQENRDLQELYPLLSQLDKPNPLADSIYMKLQKILEDRDYKSDFKEDVLKAAELRIETSSLKDSSSMSNEEVKVLLDKLQTSTVWLSLHNWPQVLSNLFAIAEQRKLLSGDTEDIEECLKAIGDAEIRSRYATYYLNRYVRSRIWFGHEPSGMIATAKRYITRDSSKKELQRVEYMMENINREWEHLLKEPAPDFTFEDVNGKMVSLSDFRGHFVLLDVWNIYCSICMLQVPHLKQLEQELSELDVHVIGVSSDMLKLKDKWKAKVKEEGMIGTQVIMDKGLKSAFMEDYCVPSFPVFCLINPDGYVEHARLPLPQTPDFMQIIRKKVADYRASHKQ